MLLLELFDQNQSNEDGSVVRELRDEILDVLVPLAAQGIPFVTVQAVIDKMNQMQSGLQIDRATVMHVLDPADCKMVSRIEGDRIFFSMNDEENEEPNGPEDEKQAAQDKVSDAAMKQAKDNIKQSNGVAPTPAAAPAPAPSPAVAANPKTGPF